MKRSLFSVVLILAISFAGYAQQKVVNGKVYAFKNLPLKNIEVSASKTKALTLTDSLGQFKLMCDPQDKLEFSGEGFKKAFLKLEKEERTINVKMIFKGGDKNFALATENDIVSKERLANSIEFQADQNYEYFNYPDIYSAIDRIYAGNQNINVRGSSVYVRKDKNTPSAYPAIYIVNGKLALDIIDIQTRDIESIEIIPDGSDKYGPGAANGVVFITTLQK